MANWDRAALPRLNWNNPNVKAPTVAKHPTCTKKKKEIVAFRGLPACPLDLANILGLSTPKLKAQHLTGLLGNGVPIVGYRIVHDSLTRAAVPDSMPIMRLLCTSHVEVTSVQLLYTAV